jgi:ABC-2 type transport system ATP-binding protein
MQTSQPAIQVQNLTKTFTIPQKDPGLRGAVKALFRPQHVYKTAVDSISFLVQPGEIVGYIGVNGAGKSTTIKMLTGILTPSSGNVRVLGRDPHRQRVANAREIGVVFGQRTQLWWDLALIESLNLVAGIYNIEPTRYQRLLGEFSEMLELKDLLRTPIRNMSLGQKMRAELAAALIHEPKIVYLDEPTIGLDLIVKERIRAFIREHNRENATTVILTTHDLGDIEELCKRVIIIDDGKLIYDGPLSTIRQRFGRQRTLTFEVAPNHLPGLDARVTALSLPESARVSVEETEGGGKRLVVPFDRTHATASQVVAALMEQVEVVDFSLAEPDLAGIVKQIYQGALESG